MPRFGFRKILNHYKDSHEEHSSATEQQLDNHSNQTERDVISCEENDSVATELTESMPSHEQFHIDDEMELQPTADTQFGRQSNSDYSLPAGRKFIRPKLNARRNSSRRPKAMRQRKSCAICGKQREISVGYASDGCICDACNATILSTFKNFMDRSQRFPSGQQQQEEETQPYHEYGQSLKQRRSQSQSQSQQRPSIHSQVEQPIYSQQRLPFPSQPPSTLSQKRPSAQLVEGQEMHYNQQASQTQQAQQPTANQGDVPPFSIVVLQDCENINQLIDQLKSVLVQMLPQQCNNANNKNNNNNRSSNNNNNRSNNGSFDYGRNYTDNRCPLSQANTCSCSPPVYYGTDASSCTCEAPSNQQNREHNFNQPRKYDWRERLECDCSCDMDAGSEQSNKRKNRKKNHKKKANKNKNNKNRRNNANNNQNKVDEDDDDCDCSIIDDNEDDAANCSGCNCVCCKQNSNNETLFKLFVQILQILRDSAKDTESSKKGKKSKKGKGSKKGKKDAEDSEKKEGNGKSKEKQSRWGSTRAER
ncbi:myb-like protein AA isoform X2 [Drosophila hydei]|uniref:Myb-like protein AA isoform X2 n=1 Tax=Drosophila hydei TaxID=7224 RepID=A0A6J1MEW0_DROHY|nr:myb-like protein AA isoform X2 [Drosophila hydei]